MHFLVPRVTIIRNIKWTYLQNVRQKLIITLQHIWRAQKNSQHLNNCGNCACTYGCCFCKNCSARRMNKVGWYTDMVLCQAAKALTQTVFNLYDVFHKLTVNFLFWLCARLEVKWTKHEGNMIVYVLFSW